ncbi:hypothetical protein PPYR_03279 [Photinus pyralis]|uniref:Cns1/TTC4 wheel domain-containing protein n=4 Tax=Photinus pyralis TaxID=7054 RepID=A0A5N4A2F6_PHOPY|nr:DNA polymerase interacting tetratricopeptide repeat-containing, protein of 47 kDa [Photinus pyralis]KAB0791479.1 hypothetical protein PPYR_03279 [Photinus pyralis]
MAKKFTDEERLALAAKLDKELDDFIDGLEKRPYTEGWPEDRWQEEMEKHPFFMKKMPEAGEPLDPLMEGLQQLKYDPNENTPEELANAYKDDGNFNFKHGNYRLAIIAYTEGLKIKCENAETNATLYNNRAAAHFFLKNYRSSLHDCKWALRLKPNYRKTLGRAAKCCLETRQFDQGIEYCDLLLGGDRTPEIVRLRQTIVNERKRQEKDSRKARRGEDRKADARRELMKAIGAAGVAFEGDLRPVVPELAECAVHLNDGRLVWPVIFTYPEYQVMDFIQEFDEYDTFREHLDRVFEESPAWDAESKYKVADLHVYLESSGKLQRFDIDSKLRDVLKCKGLLVKGGTPSFIILVGNSPAELAFLSRYK